MVFSIGQIYPSSAIHGQAPILAGVPPTMRVFVTFDCPQPSSGVSKRAFGNFDGADID